jgi:hypothetical protein
MLTIFLGACGFAEPWLRLVGFELLGRMGLEIDTALPG